MKLLKRIGIVLLSLTVLCCAAAGIYAADYYHMDAAAAYTLESTDEYTVTVENGLAIFAPENPKAGFIFYPGGKVEYTAYARLMNLLAYNGVLCVIPKMPLNLAVLGINTAENISAQFPDIDTWYIGGHSLGGSMAASHASHCDKVKGLILLAAYSTADLKDSGLQVLSIYGDRDNVLNMESYSEYLPNLPADTTEIVLNGGNHAQFGSYGKQEGDGTPLIEEFEQQSLTASRIAEFMGVSEPEPVEYETEQYIFLMEREGKAALRSELTLTPELGQFVLSVPIYSSQLIIGTYTIENDLLTCSDWNGEAVYCFDVSDYGMVYRSADSAPIYAHGAATGSDPNAEAPVPDGAVYSQLMICY